MNGNNQTIEATLKLVSDVTDVQQKVGGIQKILNDLKLPPTLQNSFNQTFSKLDSELSKFQSKIKNGFKTKGDVSGLQNTAKAINSAFDKLQSDIAKVKGLDINQIFQISPDVGKKIQSISSEILKLESEMKQLKGTTEGINQALTGLTTKKSKDIGNIAKQKAEMGDYKGAIEAVNQQLQKYQDVLSKNPNHAHAQTMNNQIEALRALKTELEQAGQKQDAYNIKINNLQTEKATLLTNEMNRAKTSIDGVATGASQLANNFRSKLAPSAESIASSVSSMSSQMEMLKSRVTYFFGMANAVNLFKRAVTSALNAVKELDATMTEAAVVTDFSVGDMWNQLPRYSEEATKLGAKINDLYAATTLYYQQGLKTNAAMGAGVETMKMARIAGLDAAGATEAMTAALRGFNMEVNTMNAQHVNDVYSALAAKSASNVEQISTAMSKTASIASAANMEFETTAALLSQIIETTQEAPETAGTALKTIIARFSEVKKLASSGQASGEDEEGEIIDVNKIQTALRTVGISMDEFFKGTEGLDDILLKLAEKWGTLNFETQRYIATMAAGSRQQSRFIAMMSDYSRTTELVSIANNSAGASQEQFGKTLDSLEAKLNKLNNAWNQFLMGLANNEILKFFIDLLTGIIEGVNGVINVLSGGNGLIKSILSLGAAIGGLVLGSKMFDALFAHIGAQMVTGAAKAGAVAGAAAGNSFNAELAASTAKAPGIFAITLAKIRALFTKNFWVGITKIPTVDPEPILTATNMVDVSKQKLILTENKLAQATASSAASANRITILENKKALLRTQQNHINSRLAITEKLIANAEKTGITHTKGYNGLIQKQALLKKQLSTTNNNLNTSEKISAAIKQNLAVKEANVISLTKASTTSQNEYALAVKTAGVQLGFSTQQQEVFELALADGLDAETAAIMAKHGYTKAAYDQAIASLMAKGATEEEAKAQLLINGIEKKGLVTKIMSTIHTKAKTIADKAETGSLIGKVAALIAEKTAQDASNASKLAALGIIGLIIIAIVTLIALTAAFVKAIGQAIDATSETKKIEKLNKEIKALGESAQEAKSRFEELVEAREGLDEMQNTLEGLTRGTKEWAQQLVKTNQEVLRLINEYPELAQYIERGKEGQLTITDTGWDLMLESQNAAYTSALTAQATKTVELKNVEKRQIFEEGISNGNQFTQASLDYGQFAENGGWGSFVDGLLSAIAGSALIQTGAILPFPIGSALMAEGITLGAGIGKYADKKTQAEIAATGGLTEEQYTKFATYAAEQGLSMAQGSSKKEFQAALERSLGWNKGQANSIFDSVWNKMTELGNGFDEMANSLKTATLAQEAQTQAIAANIVGLSTKVTESKYSDIVIENTNLDEYYNRVAEVKAEVDKKNADDPELIKKYADVSGLEEDEIRAKIKENSLSKDTMTQQIATSIIDKEQSKEQEAYVDVLEKVANELGKDSDEFKAFTNLQKKEGRALTSKDFEKLISKNFQNAKVDDLQKIDWKDYIENTLRISYADLKEMGYSMEELVALFSQNALNSLNTYNEALKRPKVYGLGNVVGNALTTLASKGELSAEQIDNLSKELTAVALNGGNVEETSKLLTKALEGVSDEQKEQVMNLISLADLETYSGIDALRESLYELGIEISNDFIKKIKQASSAINDFNVSKLLESMAGAYEVIELLEEAEKNNKRSFDIATRDKIIKESGGQIKESDFSFDKITGEYIYNRGTLKDIKKIIKEEKIKQNKEAEYNIQKQKRLLDVKNGTTVKWNDQDKKWITGITIRNTGMGSFFDADEKYETNEFGITGSFYSMEDLNNKLKKYYNNNNKYKSQIWQDFIQKTGFNFDNYLKALNGKDIKYFDEEKVKNYESGSFVYDSYVSMIRNYEKQIEYAKSQQQTMNNENDLINFLLKHDFKNWSSADIRKIRKNESIGNTVIETLSTLGYDTPITWERASIEEIKKYLTEFQDIWKRSNEVTFSTIKDSYEQVFLSKDIFEINDYFLEMQDVFKDDLESLNQLEKDSIKHASVMARALGVNEVVIAEFEKAVNSGALKFQDAVGILMEAAGDLEADKSFTSFMEDLKNLFENINFDQIDKNEIVQKIGLTLGISPENLTQDKKYFKFILNNLDNIKAAAEGDYETFKSIIDDSFKKARFNFNKYGALMAGGASPEDVNYLLQLGILERTSKIALENITTDIARYDEFGKFKGFDLNVEVKKDQKYEAITISDDLKDLYFSLMEEERNWINPFDKYFNQVEQLNELLRERNQLEREYDRLIRNTSSTLEQVIAKNQETVDSLREEYFLRDDLAKKRHKELTQAQNDTYVVEKGQSKSYAQKAREIGGKNFKLSNYAYYDGTLQQVVIKYDLINKLQQQSPERGELVESYIKHLQDLESKAEDERDASEEALEAIYEELKEQNQQRIDYLNTIAEILKNQDQKMIDNAQAVSDKIADTNSEIIDALQESIDLERQIRDNTKKEEEIADMEARLAYLRRDTSGANAQEIRQLEKEITDTREEYGDTLIDQGIDRLSKDNEKAQEQRQKQIDLAQAQLDFWVENGEYSRRAENGNFSEEQFLEMYRKEQRYDSKTLAEKALIDEEGRRLYRSGVAAEAYSVAYEGLNEIFTYNNKKFKVNEKGYWQQVDNNGKFIKNGESYNIGNTLNFDREANTFEVLAGTPKQIENFEALGSGLPKTQDNIVKEGFSKVTDKLQDANNKLRSTDENVAGIHGMMSGQTYANLASWAKELGQKEFWDMFKAQSGYDFVDPAQKINLQNAASDYYKKYGSERSERSASNLLGLTFDYSSGIYTLKKDANSSQAVKYQQIINAADQYGLNLNERQILFSKLERLPSYIIEQLISSNQKMQSQTFKSILGFSTGGLADFTGPAWLDGTKSRPELVLNQHDTQNFIQLKDILAEILSSATSAHSISQSTKGDTYYDITIQVDNISSDYDVDQMAARIKQQIYEDSSYRNVNSISLMR